MRTAQDHLLAGSEVLKAEHGDIEYAVKGEGTPVLLVHGAGGGYDQGLWYGEVSLGRGYKFISVSRYGFLRSSIPENPSIKTQAALYKDLLDYLRIEKVVVIGASAGGPSAMQFANDYPDRCSALILLSAVSMTRAQGDKAPLYVNIIHLIQQSDYVYWLFAKFFQSTILNLMGVPSNVYQSFTVQEKELSQEMLDIMHPMSRRYKGTINDGRMLELGSVSTSNITAPTLIVHAKDDALVSYSHAENAHKNIKQSKLIPFDTGGHAMLSQMDKVKGCVKEFLKDISR
ncbi:MAG: hydrolase [candidate division Zixibacteria bacterium DG_27]|nr:MAG: hydrolase [candidate division Zixibacteria bacterium DG_27]